MALSSQRVRLIWSATTVASLLITSLAVSAFTRPERAQRLIAGQSTVSEQVARLGNVQTPAKIARRSASQPGGVPIAHEIDEMSSGPALRYTRKDAKFQAAGVSWQRTDQPQTVSVAVRFHRNGHWGRWMAVAGDNPADTAPDRARAGSELIWAGPADGIDAVVTPISGQAPNDIKLHLIDPGASTPAEQSAASGNEAALEYHTRSFWGADESKATWGPEYAPEVKAVTVHHTATGNNYKPEDVPAILRSMFQYQAVSNGWGDIGYNLIVDAFGRAWEGRKGGMDRPVIGAHAGGFNTGTAGVALIGNYTSTEPSPEALETMSRFIAYKLGKTGVDPKGEFQLTGGPNTKFPSKVTITAPRVFPHNFTSATACPGGLLEGQLNTMRGRAAELGNTITLRAAG